MANENVCQWRIVSSFSIKMGKKCPVGNFFDGDGKDSKGKRKIN
jgi:hypothetical protein